MLFLHRTAGIFLRSALLVVVALAAGAQQPPAVESITRTVSGEGLTKQAAVVNALVEAVQQVHGVQVDSLQQLQAEFSEVSGQHNQAEVHDSRFEEKQKHDILVAAKGNILSYEVVSENQKSDGAGWEVSLDVTLAKYHGPGAAPDGRYKLAVIPFKAGRAAASRGALPADAEEVARLFTQKLITQFTQTRKFAVLDREFVDAYAAERNLILSPDAAIAEQVKLGQSLGADFLVVGQVVALELNEHRERIEYTGETAVSLSGSCAVDYRIMVMATRQIKWADSVVMPFSHAALAQMGASRTAQRDGILEETAKRIVRDAMDNIYPIQIVRVAGSGEIILNQGGKTVQAGERFGVFALGELDRDPVTGESLGRDEQRVGTIQIVRVEAKKSYAQVVEGEVSKMAEGHLCRPVGKGSSVEVKKVPKAAGPKLQW